MKQRSSIFILIAFASLCRAEVAPSSAIPFENLEAHNPSNQISPSTANALLTAEVSAGELLDKITILEIKLEKIRDPHKLLNVQTELRSLLETTVLHIRP